MRLVELSADYEMKPFDCGDADLNGFLVNDAKAYSEKRIAKSFLLLNNDEIAAFFCLFNDKVSRMESSNSAWRKLKKLFPHDKHFSSYPAVKIGRLAVAARYRGTGLGTRLMLSIKHMLSSENSCSTFRFITVDAYLSAVPFYEKNGFRPLVANDDDLHTRLMYFDIMEM